MLLTDQEKSPQNDAFGVIGVLQLNDADNGNALAAQTSGDGVLLEAQ